MYIVQRMQMESIGNYIFYGTLTYNRSSLPSLLVSTGFSIPFADCRDLQNLMKRLRKRNAFTRPFRYFAVSERGTERGRPHFHVLFLIPKYDSDDKNVTPFNLEALMFRELLVEWRRNYGSTRKPVYKPLCTYKEIYVRGRRISNYDLHYVQPLLNDDGAASVAFYVTKYLLKRSDREARLQQALHLNLPQEEYDDVWPVVRSRYFVSKGFGLNAEVTPFGDMIPDSSVLSYIRSCVERSEDFPKYYSPADGHSQPLARYYRSRGDCYGMSDALRFYFSSSSEHLDSPVIPDYSKDYSQLLKHVSDYEKKISQTENGDYDSYADLFD